MAAYGTLVAWAQAMGHTEAAKLLQQTLDEEKAADKKLSGLAEGGINQSAADAAHQKTKTRHRLQPAAEPESFRQRAVAGNATAVEGAMVLVQLLLPTNGPARADGLAPLAETRRERTGSIGHGGAPMQRRQSRASTKRVSTCAP